MSLWSRRLAHDLLTELSREQVCSLMAMSGDVDQIREMVADRSVSDAKLQKRLGAMWRATHEEIIAAVELLAVDVNKAHCSAIVQHFGASALLLEEVTADMENARFNVQWLLENAADPATRTQLEAVISRWEARDLLAPIFASRVSNPIRLVVLGGHVRDARKMENRLFADSPFQVSWYTFEKGQASQSTRAVDEAVGRAQAVLLVTSMVSHTLMRVAKRLAGDYGIPFRAIDKATDTHLLGALRELFPQTFAESPPTS